MTFVFIEIFQQAIAQINSIEFRTKHGDIDLKRYLRNIILTCPTAMPEVEQVKLRKCGEDAWAALRDCYKSLGEVSIIPTSEQLQRHDDFDEARPRVWSYDEATCCQLVYIYAEIAERYIRRGTKLYIEGKLRTRTWEDRNTIKHTVTEVYADTFELLGSRPQAPAATPPAAAPQPQPRQPQGGGNEMILHIK